MQKKAEHHFYNKDKDKQVHSQIKMHLKNITKIEKIQKNLKYKVSKNEHTTGKDKKKNNQIHLQIKIHNEHVNNINKICKYKKLNMTEHKTDMNITKIDRYKKNEQQFYDRTQNRQEHY